MWQGEEEVYSDNLLRFTFTYLPILVNIVILSCAVFPLILWKNELSDIRLLGDNVQ